MKHYRLLIFIFVCIQSLSVVANEPSLLVKKQVFRTENFKTLYGEQIPKVQVGYETYGTLNAKKDNAILITHYFSGTSHAAGKYNESDPQAGYWDAIIGPGKAIDTNKYFVISSDTLVNANVYDPNVITTGPASTNPATGKPWGLDFPIVTIRDFVNLQQRLITHLGISKLHAVVGASMGSHQALEWSAAFPDMVPRVISVIGVGEAGMFGIAKLKTWMLPIMQDPNWQDGNYYAGEAPQAGLTQALAIITADAQHERSLSNAYAKATINNQQATKSLTEDFAINRSLLDVAATRAKFVDANHLLYLARACQLYRLGHKDSLEAGIAPIKADILLLPATGDRLLFPDDTRRLAEALSAQNKRVTYEEIEGPWGHLDGIFSISSKADLITSFLAQPNNN